MLVAVCLALAGTAAWCYRAPLHHWWVGRVVPLVIPAPAPDPVRYQVLVKDLEAQRLQLARRYRQAKSPTARAAIETEARTALEIHLPAMMRCWLGTPWDYNGTATSPGSGHIACGYFVASILKDAGFQVNRSLLAQQASGDIMRSFLPKAACTLRVGVDYAAFTRELAEAEPGIYLVGLDTHVGFLVVEKTGFRFIHSSGKSPKWVVDQGPGGASALQLSKWRMIGNLTAHPAVLKNWLTASPIIVKTS